MLTLQIFTHYYKLHFNSNEQFGDKQYYVSISKKLTPMIMTINTGQKAYFIWCTSQGNRQSLTL